LTGFIGVKICNIYASSVVLGSVANELVSLLIWLPAKEILIFRLRACWLVVAYATEASLAAATSLMGSIAACFC